MDALLMEVNLNLFLTPYPLLERKRHLMKRREDNTVSVLLAHRPKLAELESRNILLREDETLAATSARRRRRSTKSCCAARGGWRRRRRSVRAARS